MTPAEWTRPEHVVETLRRKWTSGRYLTAAAGGHPFEAIGVPLKGPTAADALQHYEQALAWAQSWAPGRNPHLRIQTKSIGGRNGTPSNTVPARAWVDTRDRLWTLLRVTTQVDHFHTLHEQTTRQDPGIARWMADHPMKVLAHAAGWHRLVRTTCWIRDHDTEAVYLREIDTPGVDTKFIETNKGILAELLDCVLPESRVNTSAPKSDLVARYGFRTKPTYIRLRYLGSPTPSPSSAPDMPLPCCVICPGSTMSTSVTGATSTPMASPSSTRSEDVSRTPRHCSWTAPPSSPTSPTGARRRHRHAAA